MEAECIRMMDLCDRRATYRLRKQKQYDWWDTNLELMGSDTDKEVKKSAAETETAWKNAGTTVGLQIWRIVKFKVVRWPEADHGKFYEGDSYILLNTYKEEDGDCLLYDVHFWIGKFSTQDEYGTAAYKTVELDTYLDDRPIQHREVQGHESKLFKSYFKTITILRGGADSGFRKVKPKSYEPRLLHFHGDKKNVEVQEIPRCKDLLDQSDVYILDLGLKLYQWNGRTSNKDERFRAAAYIAKIKQERGKCQSETFDDGAFGCGRFYTNLTEQADDDGTNKEQEPQDTGEPKKLYRLSDSSGEMTFTLEKEGSLSFDDLDTNDVFILDTMRELYVWIGNNTTTDERKNAMVYAHNYLMNTEHPLLPISCVGEEQLSKPFQIALTA